jgi:hypothetical protein
MGKILVGAKLLHSFKYTEIPSSWRTLIVKNELRYSF